MRVALVVEWLDSWRGGAETSTGQFINELLDAGVSLHVFTRSRPSPMPGMEVHTVSGASMSRTRRSVTFSHRVARAIRSEKFDVVHAISPCINVDIYQPRGGTVAETLVRNIATRRTSASRMLKRCAVGLNLKQRYMLGMERKILSGPSSPIVVALSDYVVSQLKSHYRLPDEKICKIFNGVNVAVRDPATRAENRTAVREEFGIADSDTLVLVVAHNFRLKGVDRWMEALSILLRDGRSGIRSLVVGRGDSQHYRRLADRLGIADSLVFTGPSERVPAFRDAADMLVHPTFYDPCSRVVLESLASQLPCITTKWDGAGEMIVDGESGFVIEDPSDSCLLARRVAQLCDSDLRDRFIKAMSGMAQRISMTEHAKQMLDLYEKVASSAKARAS